MLEELKEKVFKANLDLVKQGLERIRHRPRERSGCHQALRC